ncbi:unnamed protein product [Timema podura]|uniref:Calcineurin-like phosphoesterase domain-containing protein n=1 Tax=Timema podura TaxID=61482 RepID=A0ABN7NKK9_TIMPD|nr:unnamed protein product [Timema podura]
MGLNFNYFTKFVVAVFLLILYCEVIIYYLVLLQCWWPQLDPGKADNTIHFNRDVQPVRALLLADTHLLGSRNGHWFDKLRRMASLQDDMNVLELNKDVSGSESDSSDDNDIDIECNNDNEDPELFDINDETSDYWHSSDIECPVIRNCMTHKLYKCLTKYFHVSDVTKEKTPGKENYDILQKELPKELKNPKILKLKRGDSKVLQSGDVARQQGYLRDLFDEGLWCSEKEFKYYVQRFHDLFAVPEGTELYVVVGNHDVGFHYGISPYLQERFSSAFSAPSVKFVTIKGNYFVLINSMAMEGDGCFLCRPAELQLQKISRQLKCTKGVGKCIKGMELEHYSRPILLQHFPMYRESDADCHEPDQAPEDLKTQKFRERWECLSRESSEVLFDELKPRLIVTGHTHHGCNRIHRKDIHEWTISSFSWRNKDNPSFMLVVVSPNNYALSKCYMPQESTVITTYMVGAAIILIWVMLTYRRLCRRSRLFKKK